jgi:hypothetical protein
MTFSSGGELAKPIHVDNARVGQVVTETPILKQKRPLVTSGELTFQMRRR